uniref:Uncharacterized protein n=1 Tax=Oryza sativa subsp. japonica TaxID=39947 RepID=Q656K9_ORYSJ|nr:hypothetical protein [Oryza sativa Japonica Group]
MAAEMEKRRTGWTRRAPGATTAQQMVFRVEAARVLSRGGEEEEEGSRLAQYVICTSLYRVACESRLGFLGTKPPCAWEQDEDQPALPEPRRTALDQSQAARLQPCRHRCVLPEAPTRAHRAFDAPAALAAPCAGRSHCDEQDAVGANSNEHHACASAIHVLRAHPGTPVVQRRAELAARRPGRESRIHNKDCGL